MEEEENEGWRMGTENDKPKIRIRMKATDSSEAPAFLGKKSSGPRFQVPCRYFIQWEKALSIHLDKKVYVFSFLLEDNGGHKEDE